MADAPSPSQSQPQPQSQSDDLDALSGRQLRQRAEQVRGVTLDDLDAGDIDAGAHDEEIRNRVRQAQRQQGGQGQAGQR